MSMDTLNKLQALAKQAAGLSDAQQCMRRCLIILSGDGTPEDKFVRLARAVKECPAVDRDAVLAWLDDNAAVPE